MFTEPVTTIILSGTAATSFTGNNPLSPEITIRLSKKNIVPF